MGRRAHLTPAEKAVIVALHREGLTEREIRDRVKRSKTAVHNVINSQSSPSKKENRGRKSKLSPRMCRKIVRKARAGGFTARKLCVDYGLPVSIRRVQQVLSSAQYCEFEERKKAPALTPAHKAARLDWCETFSAKEVRYWNDVIFSDEKRSSLDGPDSVCYYWADPIIVDEYFSKRPRGGGGWMVWAGVSSRGKTPLVFIDYNMDGAKYTSILEEHLLPLIETKFLSADKHALFQQDHASCHISKVAQDFFCSEAIDVLPWAPKSPDLNIIENIWGLLVRRVYYGYRQFETKEDLRECLEYEWEKLDLNTIRNYVRSMPKRCSKVMRARGGPTRY